MDKDFHLIETRRKGKHKKQGKDINVQNQKKNI
jgi:hypothetical protein